MGAYSKKLEPRRGKTAFAMDTGPDTAENKNGGETTIDEIQIMVFRVMGVLFGADMEQIREVANCEHVDEDAKNVKRFHEEFSFSGNQVIYEAPRILYIKDGRGFIVDHVEEVRHLPIENVRPLPELLGKCRKPDAIWGAGLFDDKIVLLLDFFK